MARLRGWPPIAIAILLAVGAACGGPGTDSTTSPNRVCVALAVDAGVLPVRSLEKLLHTALDEFAHGGSLRVWQTTASGVSPNPIELEGEDDLGGVVAARPTGDGTRRAGVVAARVKGLANEITSKLNMAETDAGSASPAVPITDGDVQQMDLFGSLETMGTKAASMHNCKKKEGMLVSGGGIHRTPEMDFLNVAGTGSPLTRESAEQLHVSRIDAPPNVSLRVFGAGDFEGVNAKPAFANIKPEFAEAEIRVWRKACPGKCVVVS